MPAFVPLGYQIAELERELKVRARVYARWVQTAKMKPEVASRQIEHMEAARDTLLRVLAAEELSAMERAAAPAAGAPG